MKGRSTTTIGPRRPACLVCSSPWLPQVSQDRSRNSCAMMKRSSVTRKGGATMATVPKIISRPTGMNEQPKLIIRLAPSRLLKMLMTTRMQQKMAVWMTQSTTLWMKNIQHFPRPHLLPSYLDPNQTGGLPLSLELSLRRHPCTQAKLYNGKYTRDNHNNGKVFNWLMRRDVRF